MPVADITGQRFGRLVAVSFVGRKPGGAGHAMWQFRCDCGGDLVALGSNVKRGYTVSCGCRSAEARVEIGRASAKHGHWNSATYTSYHSMLQRCTNPRNRNFRAYGAMGVEVCSRWLESFEHFLKDMGVRPAGTTIDRIDGCGNYEPGNCRWATDRMQNNNLRSNRRVEYQGVSRTVAEWARELGMPDNTLRKRLGYMSVEAAFTRPYVTRCRH